jgi:Fic family protein
METKDKISLTLSGTALIISLYNFINAYLVNKKNATIFVDDKRFDILNKILETQTLREEILTDLRESNLTASKKKSEWLKERVKSIQDNIELNKEYITHISKSLKSDEKLKEEIKKLMGEVDSKPDNLQILLNNIKGKVSVSYYETKLDQAKAKDSMSNLKILLT